MAGVITITAMLNKPANQQRLKDILITRKQKLMQACDCMPVRQADTAYHLLNYYGFQLSIDKVRDEMAIWAQQDEDFLKQGLCNITTKYSKTYDQLIADALRSDTPATDVTFFILSCMRRKTIGIVCGMREGWSTHYNNNWDELNAILVWMGHSNFGACKPMTCPMYQADIGPYTWPLADPDQPAFVFLHIQQQ